MLTRYARMLPFPRTVCKPLIRSTVWELNRPYLIIRSLTVKWRIDIAECDAFVANILPQDFKVIAVVDLASHEGRLFCL